MITKIIQCFLYTHPLLFDTTVVFILSEISWQLIWQCKLWKDSKHRIGKQDVWEACQTHYNHGGSAFTSPWQDQSNKRLGGHFCACSFLWKVVISYHCSKQFKLVKQQTRICILVPREKLVPLCILPKLKVVSASVHKQYLFDFHKSRTVFFHCSVKLRVWALIRTWVFLHILNGTGGTSYTNLVPCRLQSPCASCTTEPKGDYRTSTL